MTEILNEQLHRDVAVVRMMEESLAKDWKMTNTMANVYSMSYRMTSVPLNQKKGSTKQERIYPKITLISIHPHKGVSSVDETVVHIQPKTIPILIQRHKEVTLEDN
uniref:Uncharacterized protein n=1 Tax=Cacopsylla melanoneura TaxID=428564 RepID=A0A8D9E3L9_9HEMI